MLAMTSSTTHPTAPLRSTGLDVSRLALGTMTFGVETAEDEAFAQLDAFVAAGGTLIDTADAYATGGFERIVGRWLADRRPEQVVVATKGRFSPPPGSSGASRRGLVRAVDASLERLGTDAIDLYLVHGWDERVPVEETLDTLSSLVRAGKIHHVGWSNVTGWHLQRIITTARLGGTWCRSPSRRSTTSWTAASSWRCSRPPARRGSAWCRGRRWAGGG